jgi:hypothetical protein
LTQCWIVLIATTFPAALASAQWLNYPTAKIPRTRDGKPNLSAPAPRTRDGKPDLSGIWMPELDPKLKGTNGEALNKLFIDVSRGLPPGALSMEPWAEALYQKRSQSFEVDDPLTTCKPVGVPRVDMLPATMKIVQNRDLIIVLHEAETTFRQIHTDGRKLPEDPQPSFMGYSTGAWANGVLVVQTIGFHDEGWLDAAGHPHSDALRVTERFLRRDFGHLEIQITIDDAKAYKKPFTVMQNLNLLADTEMLEYFCSENERDVRHFVVK